MSTKEMQENQGAAVYVAGCDNNDTVKIGISKYPRCRLSQLRGKENPEISLQFVGICETEAAAKHIEHVVHSQLWLKRQRGEWFNICQEEAKETVIAIAKKLGHKMTVQKIEKRKMGRPLFGEVPMQTIAVRLLPHDIAALNAYSATKGLKGPGAALRALALEGLQRLRRSHNRLQKVLDANRSYFTK